MTNLKIGTIVSHKYGSFKKGQVIGFSGNKVKVYFSEEQAPAHLKGKPLERVRTVYPTSVKKIK